jgi:NAD(P)-dependent dehydrogenase (short-subunit alcohol dehydrogenase family)
MELQSLVGKNLVIIGGTSGIGLSTAEAFVRSGAKVVLIGRDEVSCTQAQNLLGDAAIAIPADARDPQSASSAIDICLQHFGSFDGICHVAGGSGRSMGDGPLHELTLEGWNKTLELNLTSMMLSNQAAIRKFLERGQGGSIVNLSSVLGFSPSPQYFSTHAYATSKAAILGFSKSIAAYYAKDNIRVNVIAPGLVETPMSERASKDEEIMSYIKTKQPLDGGRIGCPSDISGLMIYFMSELSKFTTGQVIAVDGAWSLSEGQRV